MATRKSRRGPPNGRAGGKSADRQRILDAAERVFAARGFPETRMQDIAAEARVSLRNVYAVAKGKQTLFRAVHEARAADLLTGIESTLSDETADPRDLLMDVIATVATFLMDHPEFLRIQLREGGSWALDDSDRLLLVEERHASDRLLERLLRRGIRAGAFNAEDPRMMVASLRAQQQVQLAAWTARRGRISKKATIEAIQRAARRLFFADRAPRRTRS